MVGCFPKTFRKTYVINQKPLEKSPPKKDQPSPVGPGPSRSARYSRFIDDLIPSTPITNGSAKHSTERVLKAEQTAPFPIIKIIEITDNETSHVKETKSRGLQDSKNINQLKNKDKNQEIKETKRNAEYSKMYEDLPGTQTYKSESALKIEKPDVDAKTINNYPNGTLLSSEKRSSTQERALPELPKQSSESVTKEPQEKSRPESKTKNDDQLDNKNKNQETKETKRNAEDSKNYESLPNTQTNKSDSASNIEKTKVDSKSIKYSNGTFRTSEERSSTQERALPELPKGSSESVVKEPQPEPKTKHKKGKAPTVVQFSASKNVHSATKGNVTSEESIYHEVLPEEPRSSSKTHKLEENVNGVSENPYEESIYGGSVSSSKIMERPSQSTIASSDGVYGTLGRRERRSGVQPVRYDPKNNAQLPVYLKTEE